MREPLATIQDAPEDGWLEIAAPEEFFGQNYESVRLRLADGAIAHIAGLEFYAPGSGTPLTGVPKGSAGAGSAGAAAAAAAFDGNDETCFIGKEGKLNWCGLEFDGGPGPVARMRVLPAPGHAAMLKGATLEAFYTKPDSQRVLTRVETGDGRAVDYEYNIYKNISTSLTGARYGDGTAARYKYAVAAPARAACSSRPTTRAILGAPSASAMCTARIVSAPPPE